MAKTVRQKRKNKSSRPIVRQVNSRKKHLNPTANAIIAQNWYDDGDFSPPLLPSSPFPYPSLLPYLYLSSSLPTYLPNQTLFVPSHPSNHTSSNPPSGSSTNTNPFSPSLENRNKKQTHTQNYRRLGLLPRLQKASGGTEPILKAAEEEATAARPPKKSPFAIRALPPAPP